ncbi:MFS transporter [Rhodovibrio salinarum]|nr:MFS transporter [Rhodovibrio salinarum]
MTTAQLTAHQRALGLGAVVAASVGVGGTIGMLMPLANLTLERWELSATLIGLNSSVQALAMLVVGPFLAGWVRRLGAVPALILGTALGVAAILALPLFPALGPWFVLRFLIGTGMALPWLVAETWVNAIARESSRARVIAVYSIALFAGLALGPQLLQAIGREGVLPFVVCAGLLGLSALPMVAARGLLPDLEVPPGLRIHQVLARAPTVAGAALIAGVSESACYMLLPVYGVRAGVGETVALTWLTVLILGAVAWQFPMGWLADRMDRQRLLGLAGIAGALVPLALLTFGSGSWVVWPLLFVYGGIALGYYTVGLAHLGARFGPGELAVANAGFMVLYETGTTVGPALAGTGMELWAPHGYLVVLSAFGAAFAVLVGWRRRPMRRG